jgi:hypothetical protein
VVAVMTVSATLDKTVRLYRANFKPLITIAAISGLLQFPLAVMMSDSAKQGGRPSGGWMLYLGVACLTALLAWPLQYGSLGKGAIAALAGKPVTLGDAFRTAFSRFFPLLGAGILAGVCTLVGTLLLVVPGVYIFLGLSLAPLVIVDEGLGIFAGLRRSWALADGHRWRILGLVLAWGILVIVLSYGVSSVLHMVGLETAAAAMSQQVAQILIAPCYPLSLMLIIDEVRTTREGQDLALEAQRLAESAGAGSGPPPGGPTATL